MKNMCMHSCGHFKACGIGIYRNIFGTSSTQLSDEVSYIQGSLGKDSPCMLLHIDQRSKGPMNWSC